MLHRRTSLLTVATALCILSLLAACGSSNDETTETNSTSMIRIVNASSSTTGLNTTSGSTTLSSGLNFQNTNMTASCISMPSGSQTINFTSGTTGIGSVTYNFLPGQAYTVVFYGNNNAVVYPETYTAPASGNYTVRFINATGNSSDFYVTAPNATLTSTSTASSSAILANSVSGFNSTTATGGTFTSFPTSSNFVRMYNAGANPSTATSTGSYTIGSMSTTGAQTVIFTSPNTSNANATAFQVNSCK